MQRAGADGDRRGDRICRRVDHRHGVAVEVSNIDLAAVGGNRYADGIVADGDRRGDRICRRVDHRDDVAVDVCDVGVLCLGC